MQVPTRLSLILTVALLVGTLAASGTVGARLLAKRRAVALASADAQRRETRAPSAAPPEASAHVPAATNAIEGHASAALSEAGAHTSTVTQPPSHAPSADPEHALPLPSHSAAEGLLPRPPEPTARSKARDGVRARGVARVIATASGPDWDDEERPPPGPPPPVSRPDRPGPAKERARPAPGAARAPIVVPRSVNEWGT